MGRRHLCRRRCRSWRGVGPDHCRGWHAGRPRCGRRQSRCRPEWGRGRWHQPGLCGRSCCGRRQERCGRETAGRRGWRALDLWCGSRHRGRRCLSNRSLGGICGSAPHRNSSRGCEGLVTGSRRDEWRLCAPSGGRGRSRSSQCRSEKRGQGRRSGVGRCWRSSLGWIWSGGAAFRCARICRRPGGIPCGGR